MLHDDVRNLKLDDRLESYRSFFDHPWAREIADISASAKILDSFVFDLMMSLKGLSRTFAIPSLAVDIAKHYSDGYHSYKLDGSLTMQLVNHIAERIDQRIVLASVESAELRKVMFDMAKEISSKAKGESVEFPKNELWDAMVKVEPSDDINSPKNELRIALWSTIRVCYSGVFFAYEDFVVRCVHTSSGSRVRISQQDEFKKTCRQFLGDTIADSCWLDQGIITAKMIRHALAHVGGRETGDLKKRNHVLEVIDGVLQILPVDVHGLFRHIMPRIKELVEWSVKQPAFQ